MNDTARRKITETLQRDLDRIADLAAARLLSQLGNSGLPDSWAPSISGDASSSRGQVASQGSPDEGLHIIKEGFARFGGVLSLSVLVDEPGLVADNLDWLDRMMGARSMQLGAPMAALLTTSYIDACSTFLEPADIEILDDQIARAMLIFKAHDAKADA
jgi:hypothetical protein